MFNILALVLCVTLGRCDDVPQPRQSDPPASPVPALSAPANIYVPSVEKVRTIYLAGQQIGNIPNLFIKAGDSTTTERWYLFQIGEGLLVYGDYESLRGTVDYYLSGHPYLGGNSFDVTPIAAHGGWDSFDLLDPRLVMDRNYCAGLSPFECSLEVNRPSVALIAIGTNDANEHVADGSYEANLRTMIELSISRGVIPVLNTVPWNIYRGDTSAFNQIVMRLANEYATPYIDYQTPMDQIPNRGVREDLVHPSYPPDGNAANFTAEALQYGYPLHNLLTVQMLDTLYQITH